MKWFNLISANGVEWTYISQLIESVGKEGIRNYIRNQILWHVIKANRYRFYEYFFKVLTIIAPTAVLVLEQFIPNDDPIMKAILLVVATISSVASSFAKIHDKRVLYRTTAEILKNETTSYVNRAGIYTDIRRDEIFLNNVYEIVKDTNSKWQEIEQATVEEQQK